MRQFSRHGDVVSVRRQRWRVEEVRPHTDCVEVALVGMSAANAGIRQRVLTPFDRLNPVARRSAPRRATTTEWRREIRSWFVENRPPGSLRSAHRAGIELRPHQLQPALAVVQGRASRLLLADAVGLGKTIQAGLIIAELRIRGMADRVLVLAPAGLRDQWAAELRERFELDADVLDAAELRRRAAMLPATTSPWATAPIAIASIDYVKQAHVLSSAAACRWDVVVIDEAHGVAGDSARKDAARLIASQARYVLLSTATPHSGDRRQFEALCDLGSYGDRLIVFRRTRRDVPLGAIRKVHRLRVRIGGSERRMHVLLERFGRAVLRDRTRRAPSLWLALAVLHKRALSSPFALLRSVERRLEAFPHRGSDSSDRARQLTLPFQDPKGELIRADEAPDWPEALNFADARQERSWLERLAAAARNAGADASKFTALVRLLRRVHEPAIVFTEYRDTLRDVESRLREPAIILHGGLARSERNRALADFANGRRRLLLATDAAAEGLNLQRRCRLVINLELPWNPMRLEQRIGRVDRIGQQRTVHAFHLIATGTGEDRLLAHLRSRIARARADIGTADPLDGDDDESLARLAIAGLTPRTRIVAGSPGDTEVEGPLAARAVAEAARLQAIRAVAARRSPRPRGHTEAPLLVRTRHRTTRCALAGRTLLLVRAVLEDGFGRSAESALVPLLARIDPAGLRAIRSSPALLAAVVAPAFRAAQSAVNGWLPAATEAHRALLAAALDRERHIRDAQHQAGPAGLFQPELFSRRADRERARAASWARALDENATDRIRWLEAAWILKPCRCELLLVLTP